jgi:hypothetical protein
MRLHQLGHPLLGGREVIAKLRPAIAFGDSSQQMHRGRRRAGSCRELRDRDLAAREAEVHRRQVADDDEEDADAGRGLGE